MSGHPTRKRIWGSIAAGALVLTLAGCGRSERPEPAPAAAPAGERLVVREAWITDYKPVAGEVAAKDMAEARARIGGTLTRLLVDEGDMVRKGQLIGVVSDATIGLRTRAYAAEAAAAQAESARAQADLARTRDLYSHGVYAKARLEQVEAAARSAAGMLGAAHAQRAASAELAAQGAILAPASGRVLRATVPAGSVVSPGQAVATVAGGEPVLRIEVPEGQAGGLRPGLVVAVDDAAGGLGPTAVVEQVYPSVSAGRVVADLRAANLAGQLVGRRVSVRAPVGQRRGLTVPAHFIITRFGVDYARVVARDGAAADVIVQIAPAGPGQVEVLSGLAPGDVLIRPGGRP